MNKRIRSITCMGLMTAVIAVLSVWQIPVPFLEVGLTLQTFAVSLAGYMLKGWRGSACTACYIVIGGVGLPVFSGFRGGLSVLAGPGGGFIMGFVILSLLCGIGAAKGLKASLGFGALGLVICHVLGILQYSLVTATPFIAAVIYVSLPFILKDMIFVVLSCLLSRLILKRIKRA